ncbi:MAG: hypothetical protein IT564_06290 [Rhodospirillales bacterium]|nr:hypothetical protein [Rhodospirillales bacterium]
MPERLEPKPSPAARAFARRLLAALAWAAFGLGAGYALCFLAIEPEAVGRACLSEAAPWGCALRRGLISLFHFGILGGGAAAAGLFAVFGRRWRTILPRTALIAGGLALALYNAGLGSVAVVLGLLAAMAPGDE